MLLEFSYLDLYAIVSKVEFRIWLFFPSIDRVRIFYLISEYWVARRIGFQIFKVLLYITLNTKYLIKCKEYHPRMVHFHQNLICINLIGMIDVYIMSFYLLLEMLYCILTMYSFISIIFFDCYLPHENKSLLNFIWLHVQYKQKSRS